MENQGADFSFLIVMFVLSIPIAFINYLLAKRKGERPGFFAVVGLVPYIGWASLLYLVGITDKDVYDRLGRIEQQLATARNDQATTRLP